MAGNLDTEVTESGNFLDSLPEDLRGEASLQDFKDQSGLAKSYVSLQKMLGSSIRIPTEDASAEAKQEFYNKLTDVPGVMHIPEDDKSALYAQLGRPEDASGYELRVEGEFDSNQIEAFKPIAHELGLNQEQFNKLAEFDMARNQAYLEGVTQYKDESTNVLKEIWGSDFDNRLSGAKAALGQYAEKYPQYVNELADGSNPFGNNPIVIMALSELHKGMQEKGTVSGQGAVKYGISAEEARNQVDDIRANRSHPYNDPTHPGHRAAVEKVQKLYKIMYE